MILFYLGQVPAQWFTEAGDAALAGGVLRFFEVGTSTPKAVYSDYQGVTAAGTSVTLDASGRANVFLNGLYSVTLEDSDGVQIGPKVDGVGNAALVGDGYTISLLNYDDLRGFDGDDFRAAVIQGREFNGDGGAGLFVWDSLETASDDGGTILAPDTLPASGRWVRVRGETVDPRWYGCKMDGTTADDAQFAIAVAAALAIKARIHLENGYVRLTSNFSFPSGSNVSTGNAGGFTATAGSPTITFLSTRFSGSPGCFAGLIQPIFSSIDVAEIPLSWMGGSSTDAMLDKWAASLGVAGQKHILDKSISGGIPTFAAGALLDIVPGALWSVNATGQSLSVDVVYNGDLQWLDWGAVANVGTVNIGDRACPISWFGAAGDITTDDTLPLYAAIKSGWMRLGLGKYRYDASISVTGLRIEGLISDACAVADISNSQASMPISSFILDDGNTFTASGNVALDSVGFFHHEDALFEVEIAGTLSARNCVLALYDGTFVGATIDTQDCYANSHLIFDYVEGDVFHSNLKTNSQPGKRLYKNGFAVNDIYHLDEIGTSGTYDIVLTADNATGLEEGKTSLTLEDVHVGGNFTINPNRTLIEFTAGNIYRDGVSLGAGTYYDIQSGDRPIIAVINNNVSTVCQIRPATIPSGSYKVDVVNIGPYRVDVGDVSGSAFCWLSAYPVKLPDTTFTNGKMATTGWKINGKWSFS